MKARIRKTGEIVDVIAHKMSSTIRSHQDYVSYIDSKGIEHDRESLNYYWDFEPIETATDEHWQDVRERAAIAAMQGLIAFVGDSTYLENTSNETLAKKCVSLANALIEELKKK